MNEVEFSSRSLLTLRKTWLEVAADPPVHFVLIEGHHHLFGPPHIVHLLDLDDLQVGIVGGDASAHEPVALALRKRAGLKNLQAGDSQEQENQNRGSAHRVVCGSTIL